MAGNQFLQSQVWLNYLVFTCVGLLGGIVVLNLRAHIIQEAESRRLVLRLYKFGIIVYSAFLFLTTISRYNRYLSEAIDVFYYHSAIWQLSEFKIPMFDNGSAPVWADHFEPIIFLLVPLYWVIHNAQVIFAVQAAVAISGAIPLYLAGKKILHSQALALTLGLSYLMFGGMQYGYAYGFHPIVFFPTVFFWMYYFYVSKKTKLYWVFVVLCLFVKEEVAFIMLFWGLYLFFIRNEKKRGVLTGILGALWYLLCFQIVFPFFNKGASYRHFGQYMNAFSSPVHFLTSLVTPSYKIDTVFHTFGSFGFLLILFPPALILIIPSLFEKLLSDNIAAINGTHYSAAITGVVLVGTVEALYFFLKRVSNQKRNRVIIFIAGYLLFVSLSAQLLYGYVGYSFLFLENKSGIPDAYFTHLEDVLKEIPKNATVTALYQIAPRLDTYYANVRVFPQKHENSDYVVVDLYIPPVLLTPQILNNGLDTMRHDKRYQLVENRGGVVLFKKIKK